MRGEAVLEADPREKMRCAPRDDSGKTPAGQSFFPAYTASMTAPSHGMLNRKLRPNTC